jgi:hypothetical protein
VSGRSTPSTTARAAGRPPSRSSVANLDGPEARLVSRFDPERMESVSVRAASDPGMLSRMTDKWCGEAADDLRSHLAAVLHYQALVRLTRVEHEYDRGGALSYLAVWDVHPRQGVRPM